MSREVPFSKYQAAGNDFILVADPQDELRLVSDDVTALCDRWFGIGADGIIRAVQGEGSTFAMHLTNADGTPAAMSGNGARCLGAFLHDRRLVRDRGFALETSAGRRQISLDLDGDRVIGASVSMGVPGFAKAQIPMKGPAWETYLDQPLDLGGGLMVRASALSMGNPHLVLFLDEDPERFHVEHMGPALEHHELFPERMNVEFARVDPVGGVIDVRVWERGVGETLACGTGACAVAVAANEAGGWPATTTVRFRGGSLVVSREAGGEVLLRGPVSHVFDGVVDLEAL